jgi:hypothetical protein
MLGFVPRPALRHAARREVLGPDRLPYPVISTDTDRRGRPVARAGIDPDRIWDTLEQDLPPLVATLENILASLGSS